MTTTCPIEKPCAAVVVIVTVLPASTAPVGEAAMVAVVPKDFAMVGAAKTLSVALAVAPGPDSVALIGSVVFIFAPALVALTLTLSVQEPLAASEPPLKLTLVAAGFAVNVPPQPVLVAIGVASTSTPAGKLSLNEMPLSDSLPLGLLIVKVSVEVSPTLIGVGEKALLKFGGVPTVSVAVPVLPVPPLVEVTLPVVLTFAPAVVAVTLTVTVQVPLAAIVPPEKLTDVLPAAGAKVGAPQPEVEALGVAATCNPAGNVSVKATPVRELPVFELVMVKVSVLTPPTAIAFGENALAMLGGPMTVSVSVPVLPVPPLVEVTLPVVLTFGPAVVAVTLTVTVQVPLAVIVPPEKLSDVLPAAGAKVGEPQPEVEALGVAATCNPAGNVSVKATPVRELPVFELVTVKVSVLTPPTAIGLGEKALAMLGGPMTVSVSVPVLPVPPLVEVTLPVVLTFGPAVVAVTLTVTVQVPLAAIVPPEKLSDVLPAAGAKVGAPQPEVEALGVAATCNPAGNVSVKATPVRELPVFELVTVKVSVLTPPRAIGLGENALAMLGGPMTVSVSVPVLPVPPLVEVTLPVVLTFAPAVVAVTLTVTVQVPLAAIVPPEKLSDVLPAAGAKVGEPQPEVEALGVAATCNPAGNVSVKATPVRVVLAFGLVTVKVSVLTPPRAIGLGENALAMLGGAMTVSVAVLLSAPAPPSSETTLVALLFHAPACAPCTVTSTVQIAPAANMPLEKVTEFAVVPTVPLHCGVVALTPEIPAGNASWKPMPVSAVPLFGLVITKRMVVLAPRRMLVLATSEVAVPPVPAPNPAVGFV
jgi:hypothetical protein